MVTLKDFMAVMDAFAPTNLAEDWDNCGLLVGDETKEIKKILIALEPSMLVIDDAIQNRVDLIVTHHPLMLNKINRITTKSLEGQKIMKLIKNDISLYAAHTNLDKAPLGLNQYLAEFIGLKNIEVLSPIPNEFNKVAGLGRIGDLELGLSLEELGRKIKSVLKLENLQFVGEKNKKVKKVALVTGSGLSELNKAIVEGADVFITGDLKYHNALYAKEMGIAILDATHFGSENIVITLLGNVLKQQFEHIEILLDTKSNNPIKNL